MLVGNPFLVFSGAAVDTFAVVGAEYSFAYLEYELSLGCVVNGDPGPLRLSLLIVDE